MFIRYLIFQILLEDTFHYYSKSTSAYLFIEPSRDYSSLCF